MKKGIVAVATSVLLIVALMSQCICVAANGAADDKPSYNTYRAENSEIVSGSDKIALKTSELSDFSGEKGNDKEQGEYIELTEKSDFASFSFNVSSNGAYAISITYCPSVAQEKHIGISVSLDGKQSFEELSTIQLPRFWENDGDKRKAANGDEIAPHQKESFIWSKYELRDSVGLSNDPFVFLLDEGEHTITVELVSEAVKISQINIDPYALPKKYEDVLAEWKSEGAKNTSGEPIVFEGEAAVYKTLKSIIPKSDSANAGLSPADATKNLLNHIGSSSWASVGESIVWKFNVPSDGLYALGFHYRQNYVLDGYSYRRLEIDGSVPFAEASQIGFKYAADWKDMTYSDSSGEPYRFYLKAGEHTLKMTVTMGPLAELNEQLADVVLELGTIYRKITMVVGETADANRDYNLFGQIANLKEDLTSCSKRLKDISNGICELSGIRSNSSTVVLQNMANVIDRMLRNPYRATDYKTDFYNNYCSLGSILYEMRKTALDIDTVTLAADSEQIKNKTSFVKQLWFSFARFFYSFVNDYEVSDGKNSANEEISLWINWGRDQAQVLSALIEEDFTPEYNIEVNVKITNASLIQSMLSGNGTDVYLRLPRSQPVNMALRGALCDLTKFDDYEEVISRFMPDASVPYQFEGGCYALPDTQTFYMMFYRKDIFEEFGVSVPKTWEEFLKVMTVFSRNNMQVGIPYTQFTGVTVADEGVGALNLYSSLLLQSGGDVYNEALTRTNFDTPTALQAFQTWTDFYTEYKMPVTYDFYNRFRSGEMPLAIQPYTQYSTLSVAALEISGLWGMAPIPGTVKEDGTIDNTVTGGGAGSVILAGSKHKKAAWEFLKWWTAADTQARYVDEIEAILGVAARQPTATVEALKQLSWETDDLAQLLAQWEAVEEIPEAVGSYYTSRSLDQAFWSVYNSRTNPRDTLTEWGDIVNEEITRKRAEYDYN